MSISAKRAPINTFESDNTEQADLRGGRSPWFERAGHRSRTGITYLYARTTVSGRIIIGGEDSDEIIEPEARDALIPEKSRVLAESSERSGRMRTATSRFAWAGTFDTTRDGLPLMVPCLEGRASLRPMVMAATASRSVFGGAVDRRADRGIDLSAGR